MAKRSPEKRDLAVAMIWQGDQMVMQHRTHEENRKVGLFGGKLKPGEEPDDGVIREVWEETGYALVLDKLRVLDDLVVARRKIHVFTYLLPHTLELIALEGAVIKMHAYEVKTADNLTDVAQAVREKYIE